jgi:hydrogenase nickel incorporation protein HypA/HybF
MMDMHEFALMGEILRIIQEDAENNGITKIENIELLVGELSNAMPDSLLMAFDIYKEQNLDAIAEDATLLIQIEMAKAECMVCKRRYVPEERISFCPNCGLPSGKVITGEALQVLSYQGVIQDENSAEDGCFNK